MKLIPNWKETLSGAWSVRLLVLAAFVSVLPLFISLVTPAMLGLDPLVFAIIAALVNMLAIFARVLVQPSSGLWRQFWRDESGAIRKRHIGVAAGVLALGIPLTAQWEGKENTAYWDSHGAVWTVCFGETRGVEQGDRYSDAECTSMLKKRWTEFHAGMSDCVDGFTDAPAGVQASVTSWAYNVGTGAACGSTLAKHLRARRYNAACNELPRWNLAGGRVLRGLVNRRQSERIMCLKALGAA
ncbi:lysozyme [Leisingera sp. S132]|uniref:lysozyme n=1 Tax=Leisingera sp. S132 TaxID=2867016 RepID=UPI0021A299B8|nr:lysozyme [Leisingera sp. S132]UWQ77599.1 lysozyme [Leisingera sp. S132]